MSNTIDQAKALLNDRIATLRAEIDQVQDALNALDATGESQAETTKDTDNDNDQPKKSPRKRATKGQSKKDQGEPSGRTAQVIDVVTKSKSPVTVNDVAKRLKCRPTYIHRVVAKAINNGHLAKDGRTLVVVTK